MELAIRELECSVGNVTLKSFSSVHFLFKHNRKQMEQGGPTCHRRTPQALASSLLPRTYRGVTKPLWSCYPLGEPRARIEPGSWYLKQVASLLGLCCILNVKRKLPTRSPETQSSDQRSSAGKPERGRRSTAGILSALGKRIFDREKEVSEELSNMKERLLPKESFAICGKSWTRKCKLDLQQRHVEVRRKKIN